MPRDLPQSVADEVKWLSRLLIEKGDGEPRHATKLMQALEARSPVLDRAVRVAVDNSLSPGAMHDLEREEKHRIGELLHALDDWREGKPGPPKQFPNRLELRMDDETRRRLAELAEASGESESEIIRRLIRDAEA